MQWEYQGDTSSKTSLNKLLPVILIMLLLLANNSHASCHRALYKHITLGNIFYLVAMGGTVTSAFGFWYTFSHEKQNEHTIEKLNDQLKLLRVKMDALEYAHTPIKKCLKEAINHYESSDEQTKKMLALDIENKLVNGLDALYYINYLPDPSVFLLRSQHGNKAALFEPRSLAVMHFADCDHLQNFIDVVHSAYQRIIPEFSDHRHQLTYPLFSISMKLCGGFSHSAGFDSEHVCFSLVEAYLELFYKKNGAQHSLAMHSNPFELDPINNQSFYLPVLGDINRQVDSRTVEQFPYKAWLMKYTVTSGVKLSKVREVPRKRSKRG